MSKINQLLRDGAKARTQVLQKIYQFIFPQLIIHNTNILYQVLWNTNSDYKDSALL